MKMICDLHNKTLKGDCRFENRQSLIKQVLYKINDFFIDKPAILL